MGQTFFADKFPGVGADVVSELPGLGLSRPLEVHAVLVLLPVVRLVGRPREEILRSP